MKTPFDVEQTIAAYRRVIGRLDEERTEEGKAELRAIAQRLRRSWQEWQGEDCLHEMAFGEPDE